MTVDEAVIALDSIGENEEDPPYGDLENIHVLMDNILKEVVTKRVRDAYERAEIRVAGYVGGLWYA
jgi:hypothetical protein